MIVNMLYNEKGLLINHAVKGEIILVDNKVDLKELSLVNKTIDKKLNDSLKNQEVLRLKINIDVKAKLNEPLEVIISDSNRTLTEKYAIVEKALKSPITKENIIMQFSKLGNTIYDANISVFIDNNVFISLKYLNDVRRDIIAKFEALKLKKKEILINNKQIEFKNYHTNKKTINVLVRTEEQLKACLKYDVNIYVTDYLLYKKYKKDNVYLRLERVITNYPDYSNENLLITESGSIKYAKNNNVISDYYLNVVNDYSINLLHESGIKKVTLSVEMTEDKIKALSLNKFNLELIVYGKAELMIMKYCPLNKFINNGNKPCNICKKNYYLKDKDKMYPIITSNCLTHILHYKNIDLIDDIYKYKDIDNFRIELFDENEHEIDKLINRIKAQQ